MARVEVVSNGSFYAILTCLGIQHCKSSPLLTTDQRTIKGQLGKPKQNSNKQSKVTNNQKAPMN